VSRLAGHRALVTGAARNIGASIALRLAADGADVAVHHHDDRSAPAAGALVEAIAAGGRRAVAVVGDLGDPAEVERVCAEAAAAVGPPTLLVNNAATSVVADEPWRELTPEAWERVMRVNVTAGFLCARALWPGMRESALGAAIVNVSSQRALAGSRGNLHYATSKAAQLGLTRALAAEVAADGIRVNTVVVGAIKTPDEDFYGPPDVVDERVLAAQLIPRRGTPADVAAAVSFLCSDDAGFITGHELFVEGGALAI
jgi:NAD(P)-dependent dehydrogenase (short-subunit alcohol dehydrogenase family)